MGKLGEDGLPFAPLVSEHLFDDDFGARCAAVQALSDLGAKSEAKNLGRIAEDESKGMRMAAVLALAKLGNEGAAQVPQFLKDEEQAVRCAAIRVFSPLHSKLLG